MEYKMVNMNGYSNAAANTYCASNYAASLATFTGTPDENHLIRAIAKYESLTLG
jgi:hypothetical protein